MAQEFSMRHTIAKHLFGCHYDLLLEEDKRKVKGIDFGLCYNAPAGVLQLTAEQYAAIKETYDKHYA